MDIMRSGHIGSGLCALLITSFALVGCMDMGFPTFPDMTTYKCPAGHYLLHESMSCPVGEECFVDGSHICRKIPAVDPSGGAGPNCDAGYVTARAGECYDLEEAGDAVCVTGKITEFCRPIPMDTQSVEYTPVLMGQRCTTEQRLAPKNSLRIHIIDVGQGDAIWIQTPDNKNILVDSGDAGYYGKTRASEIVRDYFVFNGLAEGDSFDAFILTHPHSDHFGGFPSLLKSFPTKNYIDPGAPGPNSYNTWITQVKASGAKILMPAEDQWKPGDTMPAEIFGTQVKATYIFSNKAPAASEPNNASILIRLNYAGRTMLLTGDAETVVESKVVLEHPSLINSEYYKVCHHGSGTSSSENFLDAIYMDIPNADRGAFISSGRVAYSGTKLPDANVVARLKRFIPVENIFSTAAGDDLKDESDAIRDDNILIVIKPDGSKYACYSGTN